MLMVVETIPYGYTVKLAEWITTGTVTGTQRPSKEHCRIEHSPIDINHG